MAEEELTKQEKKSLKIEILEQVSSLATAGFGLVAALAWNDAIKAIFAVIFPKPEQGIFTRVGYALLITILVVIITIQLGRAVNLAKNQLRSSKER